MFSRHHLDRGGEKLATYGLNQYVIPFCHPEDHIAISRPVTSRSAPNQLSYSRDILQDFSGVSKNIVWSITKYL